MKNLVVVECAATNNFRKGNHGYTQSIYSVKIQRASFESVPQNFVHNLNNNENFNKIFNRLILFPVKCNGITKNVRNNYHLRPNSTKLDASNFRM